MQLKPSYMQKARTEYEAYIEKTRIAQTELQRILDMSESELEEFMSGWTYEQKILFVMATAVFVSVTPLTLEDFIANELNKLHGCGNY